MAGGAAGLQVGAVQDPLPGGHGGQVLLVAQGVPHDDVGAAGVERLLVQHHALCRQGHNTSLTPSSVHQNPQPLMI